MDVHWTSWQFSLFFVHSELPETEPSIWQQRMLALLLNDKGLKVIDGVGVEREMEGSWHFNLMKLDSLIGLGERKWYK